MDSNEAGKLCLYHPIACLFFQNLVFLFIISTSRLNLSIKLMYDSAKEIEGCDPLSSLSNWIVGFPFPSWLWCSLIYWFGVFILYLIGSRFHHSPIRLVGMMCLISWINYRLWQFKIVFLCLSMWKCIIIWMDRYIFFFLKKILYFSNFLKNTTRYFSRWIFFIKNY